MPRRPPPEHSRWKPGQSGNPKGPAPFAKIERTLAERIKAHLEKTDSRGIAEIDREIAILVRHARKGNQGAIDRLWQRYEPIAQRLEVDIPDDGALARVAARLARRAARDPADDDASGDPGA